MKKALLLATALLLTLSAIAQSGENQPRPRSAEGNDHMKRMAPGGCGMMPPGPAGMRMPMETWWKDPNIQKELGLSDEQIQQMNNAFQQSRNQLIDLHANLEKQEAALEPLVGSDTPNEGAILAQIDKVADARAQLEKAHARVMVALRNAITLEQWKKLQTLRPHPPMGGVEGPHMKHPGPQGGIPGQGPGGDDLLD